MSSPASVPNERIIFALISCIGVIAIVTAAVLEIRRARRGDSIVVPRQMRLRLLSAFVWIVTLGSLTYSVLLLWPERGDDVQAWRFISVISGVVLLLVIGLLLLAYDFWMVGQARRLQQAKFQKNVDAMAHAEIERMQQERGSEVKPIPTSPPDGAGS